MPYCIKYWLQIYKDCGYTKLVVKGGWSVFFNFQNSNLNITRCF